MNTSTKIAVSVIAAVALGGGVSSTALATPATHNAAHAQAEVTQKFVPLTPVRVLDTRSGLGAPQGAVLAGHNVQVALAGQHGIPADGVDAVVFNVTVTNSTAAGYVTVSPQQFSEKNRPSTSTNNYLAAETVANQTVSALADNGSINVFAHSTTDVILDVLGYFPRGSSFKATRPMRAYDSRWEQDQGKLKAKEHAWLKRKNWFPKGAKTPQTLVLNSTVVDPAGDGYLTVFPHTTKTPLASTVNYRTGDLRSGMAVVELKESTVDFYTHASAHLVLDVIGGFGKDADFTPITPARILDTREQKQPEGDKPADGSRATSNAWSGPKYVAAGQTVDVAVLGLHSIPRDGVSAVCLNVTSADAQEPGFLTVFPKSQQRPLASMLNYEKDKDIANSVFAKVGADGAVSIYAHGTTHLIVDVCGYFS